MKKNYESPIMLAEVYKTNAYCGACNTSLNGQLQTDPNNAYSDDRGTKWKPKSGFSITTADLSHTFPANPTATSTGLCGGYGSTQHEDKSQSIWECNCTTHPGETWFLEWSHYYSIHLNGGNSTFFLYKDANGNGEFDIVNQGGSYPTQSSGSDINVAMVKYNEIMVINS